MTPAAEDYNAALTALEIPVRECEPWCEEGAERHAAQHPHDRSCWSTYQVVPAANHEPNDYGEGMWLMAFLNVYLRRHADSEDVLVYIHSEWDDREIKLTLAEAGQLRDVLDQLRVMARELD